MKAIPRYVLLEFIGVFALSLVALTAAMLVWGVVKQALSEGLGVVQIAALVPYLLPDALRFAVPATALFAASTVFGRMSAANEVVALKALGIHPGVILWPVLVAAFLLSLATVWLNDVAVSWGRNGVRRVVLEAIDEIAYGMLRVNRSYSSDKFAINVKRVEGRRLIAPTVSIVAGAEGRNVTIRAAEAELRADPARNVLIVACKQASIDIDGAFSAYQDPFEPEIPLDDAREEDNSSWSPSWMALCDIGANRAKQERKIAEAEQEMAVKAAYAMLAGDFDALASGEWENDKAVVDNLRMVWHRLRTEPIRRWSTGFSCLFFVLVGAPMAIHRKNSEVLANFFFCFLPILVVYYPLLAMGVDRAKDGTWHPISVWAGNALLGLWALWLMRRVFRY